MRGLGGGWKCEGNQHLGILGNRSPRIGAGGRMGLQLPLALSSPHLPFFFSFSSLLSTPGTQRWTRWKHSPPLRARVNRSTRSFPIDELESVSEEVTFEQRPNDEQELSLGRIEVGWGQRAWGS